MPAEAPEPGGARGARRSRAAGGADHGPRVDPETGFAPLKPAEFVVSPAGRFDPYENFKFRVKWNGRYVAGFHKVRPLKRTTEVVDHREGGDPSSARKLPGGTKYEPVTLERGITHDPDFERWASAVETFAGGPGAEASLANFRKDLRLEVFDGAGRLALAYALHGCWVSSYQALPELDANGNAVAIQTLRLENDGWERDLDVVEPPERERPGHPD